MLSKKFRCAEHEDYGTLGWRPADMPCSDPLGGQTVAHDILEHFPNDDGGIEAELMALGAAVYIRGQGGFFDQGPGHGIVQNVAADFRELARHYVFENFSLTDPGRTQAVEGEDENLQMITNQARLDLWDESDPGDEIRRFFYNDNQQRMLGWLRKGFRKAAKRYRGLDVCSLSHMFSEIEETVEYVTKHAFEGSEMTVRVDPMHYHFVVIVDGEEFAPRAAGTRRGYAFTGGY
jgi:hypothetical protein